MIVGSVTIDGKKLIIKRSFGAFLEFQKITGKDPLTAVFGVMDQITMLYCNLKASNRETFTITLDAFLDYLDENPGMLDQLDNSTVDIVEIPINSTYKN